MSGLRTYIDRSTALSASLSFHETLSIFVSNQCLRLKLAEQVNGGV